jgi:galactokinase
VIKSERLERMKRCFVEHFGEVPECTLSRGPGRVNLIGEHTDYNGGYVLPMALEQDIAILGAPSDGEEVRLWSMDFEEEAIFRVGDDAHVRKPVWINYPKGVAKFLAEADVPVTPCRAVVHATVPVGGGLSSSAAFEVSAARFFLALAGRQLDGVDLARLARRAENEFVGVQCGIMDQLIAVFGEARKALFVDCRSLERRALPLFGDDYAFIMTNSMVRHALGDTEYHTRQAECLEGLATVNVNRDQSGRNDHAATLRDVPEDEYLACRHFMRGEVKKRLNHVFSENRRVLDAITAMEGHDPATFGRLMLESHHSLRDDYEVSCTELDVLVNAAMKVDGCLGSRMTGGGFGGCTVSLVEKRAAADFTAQLATAYKEETGIDAVFIQSNAAEGATAKRGV